MTCLIFFNMENILAMQCVEYPNILSYFMVFLNFEKKYWDYLTLLSDSRHAKHDILPFALQC